MLDADNTRMPDQTAPPITPIMPPPPAPHLAQPPATESAGAPTTPTTTPEGVGAAASAAASQQPPFPSGAYSAPPFALAYPYPGMPQPPYSPPYLPPYSPPYASTPAAYPYAAQPYPPMPYAQMPYAQMPYAPAALPQPPNRRRRPGYFIAACGSLLALLAFFGFPFYTISANLSSSFGGSPSAFGYSQSVTASQLAGASGGFGLIGTGGMPGLAAGLTSLLWITAIVIGGALLLCVAVPFSMSSFYNGTHTLTGWALLIGGLAAAGLTTIIGLMVNQGMQNTMNGLNVITPSLGLDISVGLGFGFYVLVAALLVIALGGIIVLARRDRHAQSPLPAASPAQPAHSAVTN